MKRRAGFDDHDTHRRTQMPRGIVPLRMQFPIKTCIGIVPSPFKLGDLESRTAHGLRSSEDSTFFLLALTNYFMCRGQSELSPFETETPNQTFFMYIFIFFASTYSSDFFYECCPQDTPPRPELLQEYHDHLTMRFNNAAFLFAYGIVNSTFGQTQATNSTSRAASLRTCTQLQTTLGSNVVQLSGTEYLSSATNAWSLYNTANRPTCIVFPQETQHVQVAMAAIFRDKIHYAVQAGGHTAMTGWNTCVVFHSRG